VQHGHGRRVRTIRGWVGEYCRRHWLRERPAGRTHKQPDATQQRTHGWAGADHET
jgi:hypothetical protein